MLNFNLQRIARLKGIVHMYKHLRDLGLGHKTATNYLSGKCKSVKFVHLEKMCLDGNLTPNDLFGWKKGPNDADLAPGHEMNQLHRTSPENNTNQILRSLPMREIEEFVRQVNERKNKPDAEGEVKEE